MATTGERHDVTTTIPLPMDGIADFCAKWGVVRFELFGSVLREDFRDGSDVDVLLTFSPTARYTLLDLARMKGELEDVFHRPVDVLDRVGVEQMRNPYFRQEILRTARIVYAR